MLTLLRARICKGIIKRVKLKQIIVALSNLTNRRVVSHDEVTTYVCVQILRRASMCSVNHTI